MRVLRVINSLKIGGAERSIEVNIPLHIANGIDMELLLLDGQDSFFLRELQNQNVIIHSFGRNNSIYNPFLIFKIIKVINNYDIIHGHLFPTFYWIALAKWISLSKVKLIFTEHSTHNRRRNNWFFRKIDKFIYKQYDAIITISDAANESFLSCFGNSIYPTIIYNGVDLLRVRNEAMETNTALLDEYLGFNIILQIAGFRPEKDQDTLIKALTFLPQDFHLVLVGDGERRTICEDLAKKLEVFDRITFLGLQNNIGSIITKADIVVMSSHWEGFGRAAIESMALGKPVIASNVPGLSKVVEGAGLLFEVGDFKELSELILQVIRDREYYELLSKKCLIRSEMYNVKTMIDKYESVYLEVFQKNN